MARVGILGAGQLGRMLALAGHPIGVECVSLASSSYEPACAVGSHRIASWDDTEALSAFAGEIEVCTFEFENVPLAAAELVAARVPLRPGADALRVASDRLEEKTLFRALGIDTAPFAAVDDEDDLRRAVDLVGYPCVLKTRRLGYDGKGQRVLRSEADLEPAARELGETPCILEGFVPFSRELSVIAARAASGEVAVYPVVQNEHEGGILRTTIAPAPALPPELASRAAGYASRILSRFGYVGLLALELFEVGPAILANEIAPRVHNSGHWTIEGAETSQFENHLRAVAELPLGRTDARGFSAMVNLVGDLPDTRALLAVPGAHVHLYGKAPRPGRKLGHVTVRADDEAARDARLARVHAIVGRGGASGAPSG